MRRGAFLLVRYFDYEAFARELLMYDYSMGTNSSPKSLSSAKNHEFCVI